MQKLSPRQRNLFGGAILLLLTAAMILLYFNVGRPMTDLVRNTQLLESWLDSLGWTGRLAYAGMVCFQVIVAIIPGEPLELAAGYAFGALEGTLVCLAGIIVGSAIVFGLVRLFGVRLVRLFFSTEKIRSMRLLNDPKRLFILASILMILPGTPKDLLTYCVGLTKMPFPTWMLICSVGRIPSIITSTLCGNAVRDGRYLLAATVFLVTALLCGVGLALFARLRACHDANADS